MFRVLLVWSILVASAAAAVAYKSQDGNLYLPVDTPTGPRWEKLEIVTFPGVIPSPDDPLPPDPVPDDTWGLIETSQRAADAIAEYPQKQQQRTALAAFWTAIADQVEQGTITNEVLPNGKTQLAVALDVAFRSAVSTRAADWQPWRDAVTEQFNGAGIQTAADTAKALRHIAAGLVPVSEQLGERVDWEKLIDFFLRILLPLIIEIIGRGGA